MSIRLIARQLNVSPATVSLALKGDARVKATTRQRVIDHCRQLGYTPSFSGRSLSTGRSFTLHVVYLIDDGPVGRFLSDFLLGAARTAGAQQYRITLSVIREGEWERLKPHLRNGSADGFVLLNPREGEDYAAFDEAGVPLVVVGRSSHTTQHVDSDNLAVGRDIAAHLRQVGYACPALIGPASCTFTRDRLLGLQALYPAVRLFDTRGSPQEVMQLGERAVQAGHDALIVTDDAMLTALLKALKRAGKSAPEIGVVGMGNDLSAYLDPEVTSVDFDAVQIGEAAVRHLFDGLAAPPLTSPPAVLTVAHRLVVRESTHRLP